MYSKFQLVKKYIHYYFNASNGKGHGIHSPFVFDFIKNVLNDHRNFYAYDQIEALRQKLLKDKTIIEVEDFGAGSSIAKTNQRSVQSIARHAAKSKKYAQLLFRVVNYYQPKYILEFGTSLGISTAYIAAANTKATIITLEGAAEIADKALQNFAALQLHNIQLIKGNFDETIDKALNLLPQVDLAFVDGNHRKDATLSYFQQLIIKVNRSSILIFDDIHWSAEMEEAWKTIKNHPAVTASIDLFFFGIVFVRQDFQAKQHFIIRY